MSALTVRMADDKYLRLKALSRRRRTSVNQLFDEMATLLLAESDAQTHFQLRALRGTGQQKRGLELLDKARRAKAMEKLHATEKIVAACEELSQ